MKPKVPEDLGAKIGTPEMVLWTAVIKNLKKEVEQMEKSLKVNLEFLKTAEKRLKEEEEKEKT